MIVGVGCPSARGVLDLLSEQEFPFHALAEYPISAIESAAAGNRPVCDVGCIACCTNSIPVASAGTNLSVLTPRVLDGLLSIAGDLAARGLHILSTQRLNLFSGTNELDHEHCIALRERLSAFLKATYTKPLGAVSSDVVFHVSASPHFVTNLREIVKRPDLWDNVCIGIDEQIPFADADKYREYLERLTWAWQVLRPAIAGNLHHPKAERVGQPRVILNLLVPEPGSAFQDRYRFLYPGGPARATGFDELLARYVTPFAGQLREESSGIPPYHRFTTATGTFETLPGSSVYVAKNYYAPAGRARGLVRMAGYAPNMTSVVIRTKAYPVGAYGFRVRACFASSAASEDELQVAEITTPSWFHALDKFVIDVESLS